jgi:hypothetical protein
MAVEPMPNVAGRQGSKLGLLGGQGGDMENEMKATEFLTTGLVEDSLWWGDE